MARWWPMEKLERSGRLVEHAQAVARRSASRSRDAATGGASDANTTAGMGIPSLDGLGPIGGNDHSPAEYLDVESIVPRTTLLAGLLLAIARDPEVLAWRAARPRVSRRGCVGSRRSVGSDRAATAGRSRSAIPAGWPGRPTPDPDRRSQHPGDVAAQTRATLAIIERALDESGFALEDVVRIRMFVTDIGRSGEVLGDHRRGVRRRSGRQRPWSR